MKKLKFAYPLPELVLSKKKDTNWRIYDDKTLEINDELSLCYGDGENNEKEFAKAKIIWIKETTFENLTNEDKDGHEKFNSEEEMYTTYSKYYKTEVKPETRLKVVKFILL